MTYYKKVVFGESLSTILVIMLLGFFFIFCGIRTLDYSILLAKLGHFMSWPVFYSGAVSIVLGIAGLIYAYMLYEDRKVRYRKIK